MAESDEFAKLLAKSRAVVGSNVATPEPTLTPAPVIERVAANPTIQKVPGTVASFSKKAGEVTGKSALGFAHGGAKGMVESIANAPRLAEKTIDYLGDKAADYAGLPERTRPNPELFPYIPANDVMAGVISVPELAIAGVQGKAGLDNYEKILAQSKSVVGDYEKDFTYEPAVTAGEWAQLLPGAWAVGKVTMRGGTKLASKMPGLAGAVRGLESWLGKTALKWIKSAGYSETVANTAVKNADRMSEFKNLGEEFLTKKSSSLGESLGEYAQLRNKAYEGSMGPLIKAKGSTPVKMQVYENGKPTGDLATQLNEVIDSEAVSPGFKKYLMGVLDELTGKKPMTFERANEIKQTIYQDYASYKPKRYVGSTPEDKVIARNIARDVKDSINDAVPEVRPINDAWYKDSVMIDNVNDVVGQATKVREGQNIVETHADAMSRLSSSMGEATQGKAKYYSDVLDEFSVQHPDAAPLISDVRAYLAAKEISSGSGLGISGFMAPGKGATVRASGSGSTLRYLQSNAPLGLYGAVKGATSRPVTRNIDKRTLMPLLRLFEQ